MMLRSFALLAVLHCALGVTETTNTPTLDSNYMVMQGDIAYVTGGPDFGPISGRIQMERSALTANTLFSFSLHFSDNANSPTTGTSFTARLGRQICAVGFTAYQDPYQCPGYLVTSNVNTCPSSSAVEVDIACTVDSQGACRGTFDWPIYIPEFFEDQNIETMSMMLFAGSTAFACGNFDAIRVLSSADTVSGITLVEGVVEKDELGYTHVSTSLEGLVSSGSYTVEVRDGPCSTAGALFSPSTAVSGLSSSFSSDSSGDATQTFVISSIADASTQSLVVSGDGDACFDLELAASFGFARQGEDEGSDEGSDDTTTPLVAAAEPDDGCDAWIALYTDAADAGMGGMGMSGKSGKKSASSGSSSGSDSALSFSTSGKKGKKDALELDDFTPTTVAGTSRCCMSEEAMDRLVDMQARSMGKGKGKRSHSSMLLGGTSDSRRAQAGVGAGVAGVVIMTAGVAMHLRRRRLQGSSLALSDAEPAMEVPTETTSLMAHSTL